MIKQLLFSLYYLLFPTYLFVLYFLSQILQVLRRVFLFVVVLTVALSLAGNAWHCFVAQNWEEGGSSSEQM